MHRQEFLNLLRQHQTRFMDELGYVQRAIGYIEEHEDCFYRELWPVHVTGSVWVIRIEYTGEVEFLNTSWQQWGKAFFKIKAPAEVMDNIFACHINNQFCSIRLHAEKINPVSRLYYPVCQACHISKELLYTPKE